MGKTGTAVAAFAWGVIMAVSAAQAARAQGNPQGVVKCDFSKVRRGQTNGAAVMPLTRGAFTPIPLEAVQFVDKGLGRKMMVQSLMAQKTPTDTVELVARLINCTDKPLQVQARSSFMSGAMAPIEPTSGWQRLFLQPRAMGVYTEKSISRDPAHYLVEVRIAD